MYIGITEGQKKSLDNVQNSRIHTTELDFKSTHKIYSVNGRKYTGLPNLGLQRNTQKQKLTIK